jgi:chorismate mutase
MSLAKIRKKIDRIDIEILEMLNERMELALQTKKFKLKASDLQREAQVLKRVRQYAGRLRLINSNFAEKVFTELIKESRKIQDEEEK